MTKLTDLIGTLKDKASQSKAALLSKRTTLALLRATSHDSFTPPTRKHLSTLLSSGDGSRATASAAVEVLMDRLQSTHNSAVALKCLIAVHHIIHHGSFILQDQLSVYPSTGGRNYLNLSNFRQNTNPTSWELSSWVRWFAQHIEQLLCTSRILGSFFLGNSYSDSEDRVSGLTNADLLAEFDSLVSLVEGFCKRPGHAPSVGNKLVDEIVELAWDLHDHEAIFRVFNQRGAKRLSDILSKARKKGKKPKWMGDNAWVGLQDKWNDKVYQALSVQNKTNRASNKGGAVHTIGRRSHLDVALDMAEKLGQSVDPGELFLFIHKKKSGEWVDSCSERTYEAYQERLRQESMQMDEDSQEVDGSRRLQIWQSETGGRTRGRSYGTADMSVNVRRGASSLTQESRAPTTTRTTHETEATAEARQWAEKAVKRAEEAVQRANEANQKVAMLEEQLRTIMALYAAERQSGDASCSQAPAPSPPPPPEHPHHYDAEHDNQSLDEADSPPCHRRRRS